MLLQIFLLPIMLLLMYTYLLLVVRVVVAAAAIDMVAATVVRCCCFMAVAPIIDATINSSFSKTPFIFLIKAPFTNKTDSLL